MTATTYEALEQKAAQARADADALAAQYTEASEARAARIAAAEIDNATAWYDIRVRELSDERDGAAVNWTAVSTNPDSTLDELFAAFTALKVASAVWFAGARQAAGSLDLLDPKTTGWQGTPRPRPAPSEDPLAHTTFNDALTQVTATRAQAGVEAEEQKRLTARTAAITKAEKG